MGDPDAALRKAGGHGNECENGANEYAATSRVEDENAAYASEESGGAAYVDDADDDLSLQYFRRAGTLIPS
ncbi:hypothetical protein AA0488_2039 [Kozakia baliensis NRIC 0488]|nr:hypothetical protein AA0488_2039 [Kozakia baliensis NRIC 0488]GEL63082.1 hypothetical protein KBA01_03680 [Kozakia baliensis]